MTEIEALKQREKELVDALKIAMYRNSMAMMMSGAECTQCERALQSALKGQEVSEKIYLGDTKETWLELTEDDFKDINQGFGFSVGADWANAKLREKNRND